MSRRSHRAPSLPGNPAKPGYFASYGLAPHDDEKLTTWMRDRLQVAVWERSGAVPLEDIERAVLQHLNPLVNIAGVQHANRLSLQVARRVMADQARAWRAPSDTVPD